MADTTNDHDACGPSSNVARSPLIAVAQWMQRVADERLSTGLSSVHLALLVAVAQYQGMNGASRASQATLARAGLMNERTGRDALNDLVRHRWLARTEKTTDRGTEVNYTVTLETGQPLTSKTSTAIREKHRKVAATPGGGTVAAHDPRGGSPRPPGWQPTTPGVAAHDKKTTEETSEKTTEETTPAEQAPAAGTTTKDSADSGSDVPKGQTAKYVPAIQRGLAVAAEVVPEAVTMKLGKSVQSRLCKVIRDRAEERDARIEGDELLVLLESIGRLYPVHRAEAVRKRGANALTVNDMVTWFTSQPWADVSAMVRREPTWAEKLIEVFKKTHADVVGAPYLVSPEDMGAAYNVVKNISQQARAEGATHMTPWLKHWCRVYITQEKEKGRSVALRWMETRSANEFGRPGDAKPAPRSPRDQRPQGSLQPLAPGASPHKKFDLNQKLAEKLALDGDPQ